MMSVMDGVGADFAKFVRSYSPDTDVNAKDVSGKLPTNFICQ